MWEVSYRKRDFYRKGGRSDKCTSNRGVERLLDLWIALNDWMSGFSSSKSDLYP